MSVKRAYLKRGVVLALAAASLLARANPAAAQGTWPLVTPEQKAMNDCPQQPGAPAIILYSKTVTDDEMRTTSVFKRIKILTPAGLDRANIEIPFAVGYRQVTELEARVIPPEGPSREFKGQVFEKTAMRYRTTRVAVKTFALPDVDVGSIIDYRYKLVPDDTTTSAKGLGDILTGLEASAGRPQEGGYGEASSWLLALPAESWEIQTDLFIKKAVFSYTADPFWVRILFRGNCLMSWVGTGLQDRKPKIDQGQVDFEATDVPPFEAEALMLPEETERMSVDIFYVNSEIKASEEYWKRMSEDWQKGAEKFLGKPGKLINDVRDITGDAADPIEQLRRIYARAQGLRNLSYEKGRTLKQRKEQKIKENRKVADVLAHGFGLRSDITRTFVALARDAGFKAEVIRVVARDNKIFRTNYLSFYGQLDSEMAMVKVGERSLLFDPATPFCPFGLVHWSRTNTAGIRFSDAPPAFFTTPAYPPDMALTQREVVLNLDAQGDLSGTIKTTYTGHEALVRRLQHLHDDETDRRKDFEKELADLLPMGASATLTKTEGVDTNAPALIAYYDVSIPGFALAAGEKIILPISPLLGAGRHPFRHAERKHHVYFPYPFREFDDIVISLPEGLAAEVRPAPYKIGNDFSAYSLASAEEAPEKLHIQRDLIVKKSYFPVDQYASIKSFYDTARTHDEAQIVLTKVQK